MWARSEMAAGRRAIVGGVALLLLMSSALSQPSDQDSCEEWETWEDSPEKSSLWEAISQRNVRGVKQIIEALPCAAKARARDGRGPLFWACEFGAKKLAAALIEAGADESATDENGLTPGDLKSDAFDEDYEDEEEDDQDDEDVDLNPYEDYGDEEEEEEEEEEEHEEL